MCVCSASVNAQSVPARLDAATLSPDAVAVYRIWKAYLQSKAGRYSSAAGKPSSYWSATEQQRWPVYDLANFYLDDAAVPEVLAVERVDGVAGEYRITTRFRSGDQRAHPATWWTAMTVTVFAAREGGRWRLANALPRHTATWRRDTVGPITYVFAPGYPYSRERARRAVAFTDSLADAFGVPRLAPLTYFLTSSVDEVYRIMGLESDVKFGPTGGAAQPVNRQLFSGIPAVGEEYRHELAHLILAPLVSEQTSYLVSEGVPTWVGGTSGGDFRTAVRVLATLLEQRPTVTLDSILSGSFSAAQFYPTGAILVDMVFQQGGVGAIKQLFSTGGSSAELHGVFERILHRPWTTIVRDWHRHVIRVANSGRSRRSP